jgi:hypothetical protein
MIRKFALALLAACGVALPGAAVAMPEADCAARWKSADGNGDGGALVKSGVPEREAEVYCEAVRRGGTMVSVRTSDDRTA